MDKCRMIGILLQQIVSIRDGKILKVESRRHCTACKSIAATGSHMGSEPVACPYHGLKGFIVNGVGSQSVGAQLPGGKDLMDEEGISRIEMPNFIAFDAMEKRALMAFQ